jgi:ceramide glucosyltransferase
MAARWWILLPAFAYQVLSVVACCRHLFRRTERSKFQPAVSVLKPVRCLDPGMYETLRSQAAQNYPEFEILFGVTDENDAAIPEIRRVQEEFPQIPIRLIIGVEPGANGKVGTLRRLARHARNPVLVVNDSDIRVTPEYLSEITAPLSDAAIGVVTCLYRPISHNLAAAWEALGIAIDFMPSTLVAPLVGVREFGLGSTLCFRADDLIAAGGFEAVSDYIADDYQLARRIVATGKRAHLSTYVVDTSLGDESWSGVWQHQLRWARTIRISKGGGYFGLPVTHSTIWVLLALCLRWGAPAAALIVLRITAAVVSGWLVIRLPQSIWRALLAPLWDLYAFAVWLASYTSNEVRWRDRRLLLLPDGRLKPTD